jgi:hypothetical protein
MKTLDVYQVDLLLIYDFYTDRSSTRLRQVIPLRCVLDTTDTTKHDHQ